MGVLSIRFAISQPDGYLYSERAGREEGAGACR